MQEKSIKSAGNYSIEEHIHRCAAWAAGRAASVVNYRFTVEDAVHLLEKLRLKKYINQPDKLPSNFDVAHRKWRIKLIAEAQKKGITISDGVAAKLINCYLKAALVCAGHHHHPKVAKIHPPIDSLLLKSLARKKGKCDLPSNAWSGFKSDEYEQVISEIKKVTAGQPLWMIEEHWQGYR